MDINSKRTRRRIAIVSTAVAATVVVGSAFGLAAAHGAFGSAPAASTTGGSTIQNALQFGNGYGQSGYGTNGYGSDGYGQYGYGQSGDGLSGSASSATLASATAAQEIGVVDITSQLGYDSAESAGTGLVLSANGEILTNNHVVEDSTSIKVTVVATGASYTASVIGTDATDDIAVLQLSDASGLSTAHIDTASTGAVDAVAVGDAVTGVGNAGGTGGTPSAAPGQVTALDQTITTQAEESAVSETLHGLIETDADIQAGDSGGPLFNASDEVIGIDTAAEQGGTTTAGYAIPIGTALTIAGEIEAGEASSTISLGYPAFLGIEVAQSADAAASGYGAAFGDANGGDTQTASTPGAAVGGVIDGTPAAAAGLEAGDTITALGGTSISSASELTTALAGHTPGQRVSVTWVDATGAPHTATVTLARGPVA